MTGLTPEQRGLLEARSCEAGHRVDGVNYPTPEGVCPLCAWPEFGEYVTRYYAGQANRPKPEDLRVQYASPSLTASSER